MNKQLLILLFIVFIDLAGFGIVIPLIPQLIQDVSGYNPFLVGVVIGLYSLFQFIFTPIWGRLSDKFGRKPILAITLLLNVVAYGIIWLAPNLWIIMIGRILGGVATGNLPVVYAYVADTSKSQERTKRLALINSMFGLGFIIGPFLGGVTADQYGIHFPFLLTAILSLVNAIFVFFALPESNKALQKEIKIEIVNTKVIKEVLTPKNISFLIFLFFLTSASLALIIGILPLYTEARFGWNELQTSYYFVAIGIGQFVTQAFLIRLLLRKFDEPRLIKIGMLIFGISTIGIGLAFNEIFIILSGMISSVGFSLMNSNIQALISLESKPEEQGAVMGVAQSASALARVVGPITGGIMAEIILPLPYYISGIIIFLVLFWGHNQLRYMRNDIKNRK